MNDAQGQWMPPNEDGVETALQIFRRNMAQRRLERRTRREDKRDEILPVTARRRLMETR